eukprot:9472051-Pyramimonas_sp.AAC.1
MPTCTQVEEVSRDMAGLYCIKQVLAREDFAAQAARRLAESREAAAKPRYDTFITTQCGCTLRVLHMCHETYAPFGTGCALCVLHTCHCMTRLSPAHVTN